MTRRLWIGLIAAGVLCLLLAVLAPENGRRTSGSTYSRAPEGYLDWYNYMAERGTPVQRWQHPVAELQSEAGSQTLVRIFSSTVSRYRAENDFGLTPDDGDWQAQWLAAGNRIVLLGVRQPVSDARFRTLQDSPQGQVEVLTRRRQPDLTGDRAKLLNDAYGAVVWRENASPGTLIFATTPHLAANALGNAPGNYAFLAQLVAGSDSGAAGTVWIDEYLHGYIDPDVVVEAVAGSWGSYLASTPVAVGVAQLVVLAAILLLAKNRRPGTRAVVRAPQTDNSTAYIEALAAVLRKANSTAFVTHTLARAERQLLQRELGLGQARVEDATLAAAWTQQTGQPQSELTPLLQPPSQTGDKPLGRWLVRLKTLRQHATRNFTAKA